MNIPNLILILQTKINLRIMISQESTITSQLTNALYLNLSERRVSPYPGNREPNVLREL